MDRWTLALGCALLPLSAQAHHSYAMFDTKHRVSASGTVRALEWSNPHVWLWLTTDAGSGGSSVLAFEAEDPAELIRWAGWTKHSLSAGEQITVEYSAYKNGTAGGTLLKVTWPDGRVLTTPENKDVPVADASVSGKT